MVLVITVNNYHKLGTDLSIHAYLESKYRREPTSNFPNYSGSHHYSESNSYNNPYPSRMHPGY